MNIFYLDKDAAIAAKYHNDSHVRKMILEYAQMLSTAHRVLDGEKYYTLNKAGRKMVQYRLPDERENILYKTTHINHPAAQWVRSNVLHYNYLYELFCHLCDEFEYRWGKKHATDLKLRTALREHPHNIRLYSQSIEPPQTMEEEYKLPDVVKAYKNFYINGKSHLARWTRRPVPYWYKNEETLT